VHRGKRTALVSMTAAVVVVTAISGAAQSAGANRLDGKLRTNQVQVLATHNSYHIQQDVPIPASDTTQYTHAPLDQQLESQGVRGFEIDVVNAPDGQFPVVHTPVVDATSNCTPLAQCLQVTRTWSEAHPGHVPIFILIEPKTDAVDRVIERLRSLGEREVPTSRVGDFVIRELAKLDKIAYIRFASVYRSFETPEDFRDALQEVKSPRKRRK